MTLRSQLLFSGGVGAGFLILLLLTGSAIGLTWDESTYLNHASSMLVWIKSHCSFDPEDLHRLLDYNRYLNPHPPLLKWISTASMELTSDWIGTIPSFRLGNQLTIAFLLAATTFCLLLHHGPLSILAFLGFTALQPRLVGQSALGTTDGVVAFCFLGAAVGCYTLIREHKYCRRAETLISICVFVGMLAKITGLLIVAPLMVMLAFHKRKRECLLVGLVIVFALAVLVAIQPSRWGDPFHAIWDYLTYPLQRKSIPISTMYLGVAYLRNLPWHYPVVMLLSTLPEWLILSIPSMYFLTHPQNREARVFLIFLGFWVLLLAFPGTPKHDEIRQFLSICPLLGACCFWGIRSVYRRLEERIHWGFRSLMSGVFGSVIVLSLLSSYPFPTMYYNIFVGGADGAAKKGLDLALYFEPLDSKALAEINQLLPQEANLELIPDWPDLLLAYQVMGSLRRDLWILVSRTSKYELPEAQYTLLFRRRSLVDDRIFFVPGASAVRRFYDGQEVMRLVRIDSAYWTVFESNNPGVRETVLKFRTPMRSYLRWTGERFESKNEVE